MPSYKAIFESLPLPAVVFSFQGSVLDCNPPARRSILEQYEKTSIAPRWLFDAVMDFLACGAPQDAAQCTCRRNGGRPARFSLSFSRVMQAAQPHVVVICKDITQRSRNEEKIGRLAAIIESSNDAMVSMSLEGTILSANRSATRLYGYERDDFEGISIFEVVPAGLEDEMHQVLRAIRGGQDVIRLETIRRRKDMLAFPVSDTYSAITMGGMPYAVSLVSRDITSRKKTETELQASYDNMGVLLNETVSALSMTVEKRDLYTAGHQHKVGLLACAMGEQLGMDAHELDALHIAGVLHDIGKICIPMAILSKPTRLLREEMALVRNHPQNGLDILRNIPFALPVGDIILQHHERLDGTGYPDGLCGDEIRLGARIIAVADVFDAMSTHRPYRPALDTQYVLDEIKKKKGVLYDPDACDALLKLLEQDRISTLNGELLLCQ